MLTFIIRFYLILQPGPSKKGEVKPVEFSITPESLENVKEVLAFK